MSGAQALLLTVSACLAPIAVQAQGADSIPAYTRSVLPSHILGEDRIINIHTPVGYDAGRTRYPVLYMPDGGVDEDFPHVVNTVDSLIALGRIPPMIVVGIANTERRRDLTGPTRVKSDSAIAPHVGGSAAFRRFIRTELMPEVKHRYRTSGGTAVIGESLAGLFIVETLVREPTLFDRYIALSPSLWWNDSALVHEARDRPLSTHGDRILYLSAADEPGIADNTAFLVDAFHRHPPHCLRFEYHPRPDLQHSTIYRGEGATALVQAFAWRGARCSGNSASPRP